MNNILRKSPIERLCSSVSITPHEMAVALAGLNPSMRISDVPEENFEYVDFVRTHLARAIKVYRGEKTSKDEPCHALDIFLASYPFIDTNTPEIIVQKISEAIDDLRGTKGWEEKARNLGGLQLVNYIKEPTAADVGSIESRMRKTGQ